jgi:hypothetical protein
MKKLLLSILLLAGTYGTTKPMEYAVPFTSALIVAAPTTLFAACHIVYSRDTFEERITRSCKWILWGAGVGVYAGLISSVPVCAGLLPICTDGAIQLSTRVLPIAASVANMAGFYHDIIHGHEEDFLSLYN